jgi:hypothetical protein
MAWWLKSKVEEYCGTAVDYLFGAKWTIKENGSPEGEGALIILTRLFF